MDSIRFMGILLLLYYFQIHLHHLLAPFPFWRPFIPLSVALLRCVSFTLARMKNSRRILAHFHLEIVLCGRYTAFSAGKIRHADGNLLLICPLFCHIHHA